MGGNNLWRYRWEEFRVRRRKVSAKALRLVHEWHIPGRLLSYFYFIYIMYNFVIISHLPFPWNEDKRPWFIHIYLPGLTTALGI